jgi:hypothetical protein
VAHAPLIQEPAERVGLGPVGVGGAGDLLRVGEAADVPVGVSGGEPREYGGSLQREPAA